MAVSATYAPKTPIKKPRPCIEAGTGKAVGEDRTDLNSSGGAYCGRGGCRCARACASHAYVSFHAPWRGDAFCRDNDHDNGGDDGHGACKSHSAQVSFRGNNGGRYHRTR